MAKIKKSYDCIVFGGGLSGLISAQILIKKNKNFLVIEPSDKLGGRLSGWSIENQILPSNLNLYSKNEQNLKLFSWLEDTLSESILDGDFQTQTFHFQDGGFKHFNGFGDKNPQALDQLNKFCFDFEKIKIKTMPQDWISKLSTNLSEDQVLLNSEITKINFIDGKAASLEINGKTEVMFNELVWTAAPQKLLDVIPHEHLGASEAKKLKKLTGVYDAVILNISHKNLDLQPNLETSKEVFDSIQSQNSVFCLYGSSLEFEPLVGFMTPQYSCWMSLIDAEKSQDHEHLTKIIKNMKRQIKRAFPPFFESSDFKEKIILSESSYGQLLLKETEAGFLKMAPNIFCTSSLCSENSSGLLGTLDRTSKLDLAIA